MVKMNVRRAVLIVVILLIVAFALSRLIQVPDNQTSKQTTQLSLMCYMDIKSVNLENHTVLATLTLEIYGIQNLTLAGISQKPNITCVQVSDSYNDELNCTFAHDYGNGTYSYKGTLEDVNWYLYSMGEGYPYDVNFIEFNIMHLDFVIGDAKYGASAFANYSYNIVTPQVKFSGANYIDLKNNWQIDNRVNGEKLDIMFNRNTFMASLIIMAPIAWLLTLVTMAPSLIEDRKTKIEVYSAILVFTPMFIFAIQTFIPPRGFPSIPEFLSVILLLLTTTFLLAALPRFGSQKSLEADMWVFGICIPAIAVLAFVFFIRLISWWLPVQIIIGLLLSLLSAGLLARIRLYNIRKKRKEAEALAQFQIV